MKKILILTTMFVALATFSYGQLSGSGHDFTAFTGTWNTIGSNEMCGPCHTPHNAGTTTDAPLWSHVETSTAPTRYTATATTDATINAVGGVSLLCMGCHDGTENLNNHVGGANTATLITGGGNVGTDLSNDHPISFTYNTALATADGGLENPSVALSGLAGGGTIDADLLFGGSMECASCHDPHGTANSSLLHVSNTNSALCTTCHTK